VIYAIKRKDFNAEVNMYIVTGGAGFIGSAIIKRLNEMGIENIVVVDRFREGQKWKNLRGLKYDEFIHADDFMETTYLKSGNVKAIYHMGACSNTMETDVDYLYQNNVVYSQFLFEHAAVYSIPIVYASSAATYGAGDLGYDDDHAGIRKFKPLNPYGYSKQFFDEWVLKQKRLPPKWFGVKFFNVYGPNEYHKGTMSSVVYHTYNQIQETGKMNLFKSYHPEFKDGEQKRDFVYVKDVVEAMIGLIEKADADKSGIYNLGTGTARTFHDLASATFKALDLEPKISFIDMPDHLKKQYQYYTQAKMDKLFAALPGFKFMSLEEGVADYVKNHLHTEEPFLVSEV
jgi:ADP-L-glycero-D-manno-heptose 6-epimerase